MVMGKNNLVLILLGTILYLNLAILLFMQVVFFYCVITTILICKGKTSTYQIVNYIGDVIIYESSFVQLAGVFNGLCNIYVSNTWSEKKSNKIIAAIITYRRANGAMLAGLPPPLPDYYKLLSKVNNYNKIKVFGLTSLTNAYIRFAFNLNHTLALAKKGINSIGRATLLHTEG